MKKKIKKIIEKYIIVRNTIASDDYEKRSLESEHVITKILAVTRKIKEAKPPKRQLYCNFEYEVHWSEDNVYVTGNLLSITSKPEHEVFMYNIDAWNKVLNERDVGETDSNIDIAKGYSMSMESFYLKEVK